MIYYKNGLKPQIYADGRRERRILWKHRKQIVLKPDSTN